MSRVIRSYQYPWIAERYQVRELSPDGLGSYVYARVRWAWFARVTAWFAALGDRGTTYVVVDTGKVE